MRKKTSVLIILSLLFVIILGASYAYSKYVDAAQFEGDVNVAVWNILVNGCNIVNPDDNSEDIAEQCFSTKPSDEDDSIIEIEKNFRITEENISYYPLNNVELIGTNKIGPGTEARFNITIDPDTTEAAFKYNLKAWFAGDNDKIKFYVIELDSEGVPKKDDEGQEIAYELLKETGYNNMIYYSEDNQDRVHRLQIKVVWENDETGATDLIDTAIGTNGTNPKLEIPVSIVFEQITSETEITGSQQEQNEPGGEPSNQE